MKADKIAVFAEAVPDLRFDGLIWRGTCPHCGRPTLELKPESRETFQAVCSSGCSEAQIRDGVRAALKVPLPRPLPVNGAAPVANEETALRPAVRGYTAKDLEQRMIPEQRWAVPRIIPQGLTILAGGQKKGKSRILFDLVLAVAAGGMAFGKVAVEQGESLYLALEDNDRRLQQRLLEILGGMPAPDELHIYPEWPPISGGGLVELRAWLEAHRRTRLVAIDTLAAFRSGQVNQKNSGVYQEDYELGRSLLRLAIDYEVSVVIAHHTNKKEDWGDWSHGVSGSVGLTGAADATLLFERARGAPEARLRGTGRDVQDFDLALKWDEAAMIWVLEGEHEDRERSPERFEVLELLARKGPLPPKDVADMLEKNQSTTRNLLLKMFRDGELARKAGAYSVPSPPVEEERER